MPAGRNGSKKAAAQEWSKMKALDAATKEGKYMIARVEKAIGFCQFLAKLEQPDGSLRDVTVLVRGKFKGSRFCSTRVEAGCFVMVEGASHRTLEVVGVVNRQSELEKLRKAGRVSEKLAGEEHALDDLFDRGDDEEDEEQAAMKARAKKLEKESMTDVLIAKYKQRAAAGEKLKEEGASFRVKDDGAEVEADDGDAVTEEGGAKRPRRRKAAAAAPAPTPSSAAAAAAPEAEESDPFAATYSYELDKARYANKSWDDEDELDIDAI